MTDAEKFAFILNNRVTLLPEKGLVDGELKDQYRVNINGYQMVTRDLSEAIDQYNNREKK